MRIQILLLLILTNLLTAAGICQYKIGIEKAGNLVKGEPADDRGSFQFVGLKDDNYVIKIEYIG